MLKRLWRALGKNLFWKPFHFFYYRVLGLTKTSWHLPIDGRHIKSKYYTKMVFVILDDKLSENKLTDTEKIKKLRELLIDSHKEIGERLQKGLKLEYKI